MFCLQIPVIAALSLSSGVRRVFTRVQGLSPTRRIRVEPRVAKMSKTLMQCGTSYGSRDWHE